MQRLKFTSERIFDMQVLADIGDPPQLSRREERQLVRQYRRGDTDALHRLVMANLRSIVEMAKQYRDRGLSLADLINEGTIGFIDSIKRFDQGRGFRLFSFTAPKVRAVILNALEEYRHCRRLPQTYRKMFSKARRAEREFEQIHGRQHSRREVAEALSVTSRAYDRMACLASVPVSLDAPVEGHDENYTLHDILGDDRCPQPDASLLQKSVEVSIAAGLATLSTQEETVLRLHYGFNTEAEMTLKDIGLLFALTGNRTSQVKLRALARLRESRRARLLLDEAFYT